MKVMVIPEDFRKDQFILKPIITAMIKAVGKSKARVFVCRDPLLRGVQQAMNWDLIRDIFDRYPEMDLFLLCVDRDGEATRRVALDHLEERARNYWSEAVRFFAENAWQEVEAWLMAGHPIPPECAWKDIRSERNLKETYFAAFIHSCGIKTLDDAQLKELGLQSARNYTRIRQRCPEDVAILENRIKQWLKSNLQ